jgi:YkoY family integral membrane protein
VATLIPQTISLSSLSAQDFLTVGFIAILEVILSVDNAIVLALIARHLPEKEQKKALTYGLIGAFAFRFIALFFVTALIQMKWVKFVGGGYLLFIALKQLIRGDSNKLTVSTSTSGFWKTVFIIEMMDIAFAVDSILAAAALSSKLWIIFFGGMIGVLAMRFAASLFLMILKKFPNFQKSAYILVFLIGSKLTIDGFGPSWAHFESPSHPSFIVFWSLMLISFLSGFLPKKKDDDLILLDPQNEEFENSK